MNAPIAWETQLKVMVCCRMFTDIIHPLRVQAFIGPGIAISVNFVLGVLVTLWEDFAANM